jgi:hypothetical protein
MSDINCKSMGMRIFGWLGFDSIAWALRRFHVPVARHALVLEVGSGGNPYPRSNVLLDAYESTRERHWVKLTSDRPTVLGFVENLPFKDNSFDYVIAAHVLEHSREPEKFILELQRVAKAGYIEVPDAFFERINPYKDHRLEVTLRNGVLLISKKSSWIRDHDLVELYENRVKKYLTDWLIPKRPFQFHVRYHWVSEIKYVIKNTEVDANWEAPESRNTHANQSLTKRLKEVIRNILGSALMQRTRNKLIDVTPLLRCTKCHGDVDQKGANELFCLSCGKVYAKRDGLFMMNQ